MAVTSSPYGLLTVSLFTKEVDYLNVAAQAILLSNTYVMNQDTHRYVNQLSGEIVDASYSRKPLLNKTMTYNGPTNTLKLSCDPVVWSALTAVNLRYVVWATNAGSDAYSVLLCCWDLGNNLNPVSNTFTATPDTAGIMTVSL